MSGLSPRQKAVSSSEGRPRGAVSGVRGRPAARRAGRLGQRLFRPMAVALRNTALRLALSGVTLRTVLRHADRRPPTLGR
ncbi:hypothetical protein [Streptomyces spirodelae]|uniref:Uncharacterized protein n=1 Tax=Streptomyces spirodelae TaxID=2812904 RepID=A0ABS3WR86_9ACTN|nr:hypothetical protein [Streptomyces spirodelae]MBO8185640.1 hypothetical protein [Streptomyces spirodelae]